MDRQPTYEEFRKRVSELEEQLKRFQSEAAKYRTLIESFPHGITVSDERGRIVETNAAAEQLLGVGREVHEKRAIDGREWRIVRPDGSDMPPDEWAGVVALKENRLVKNGEMGIARPDGEVAWINVTAAPLPLEIRGVVITYDDITEKRRMERELREKEKLFRQFFENAGFYGYIVSPEGIVLEVNATALQALGYSREQLVGRPVSVLYAEESAGEAKARFREWKTTGSVRNAELLVKTRHGEKRWVLLNVDSVKDESGRIVYSTSVQIDITDRKRMEAHLEKYKNIVSSTADGISFLDRDYRYAIANEAYEKFSGVRRERFIGLTVAEYLGKDVFETRIKPNLDRCLQGEVVNYQEWFEYPPIGKRYVDVTYFPFRDNDGHISGVIANTRDITDKKLAEDALHVNEERFRNAVVHSGIVYAQTDCDLRYTWIFNPHPDFSEADLLGKRADEIADNDGIRELTALKRHVLTSGKKRRRDISFPLSDGIRTYDIIAVPLRSASGDAAGVATCALDITARRRYEDLLGKSEERYRFLLESIADSVFVLDSEWRYVMVNKAASDFVGLSREKLIGGRLSELFPGFEDTNFFRVFRKVMANREPDTVVDRYAFETGRSNWYEVRVYPVPQGILCISRDITERKQMERALRESEEKYRSMMEAMDECAFICSADFRVEYMNPAMIRKIGRDATGEICYEAVHGLGEKCPWCQQEKVMRGETIKSELVKSESGEAYLISHSPVFHTNGTVSKLAVYRDITELKKLEARVQQAQKMEAIGNLAGGIAHDFNNILSPLIGYAELLLEELPPGGFEYESAQEILKAGKRGGDLVKQILSVGRISEPKKKPVRIQQVLNDVLKLTRSTIPSNIEMEHDIQKDCGTVMADPTQLHQIAMNLVTNANHAVERKENGKIFVELKETDLGPDDTGNLSVRPGRYARLTVSDNGCGIGPETMRKIFEPYFTTKEKGKGTGLGLAVVHGIVKGIGGDIRVYSEVGKGTTFSVYLPLLEKIQDSPAEKVAVGFETGSENILMVDDEVQIVRLQRLTLERLGYRVTARARSLDALEAFKADPEEFDLVLTDLSMPDMTGVQLAQEIHAIRADIPVIVCTGFSERISRETAEGMGIRGFLMKPVEKADLAGTIRNVLDAAKKSGA